ncbi:MAG TPA: hypothetical protein PLN53_05215 [Terricaulis sp.]|nr:hypothetical protein [Terricaulis sp.]
MNPAELHLSGVCKRFAKVLPGHEPFPVKFPKKRDPYQALVRAVVFQQLSGKAANTIHTRMLALFPDTEHPEPEQLVKAKPEMLRSAGLSRQKIAAIQDVAAKRLDGTIPEARALSRMKDDEIIERLTAARGVGRWTVEMYLIFTLGRQDVLPIDDLGVRKGAEKLYRREFTPKTLGAYGERWAPFRSAAAWHLWRVMDTQTPEESKR